MNRLKWDKANFGRIDKKMGYDLQISGEYSTNLFMCRRATGEAGSKLSIGRLSSSAKNAEKRCSKTMCDPI